MTDHKGVDGVSWAAPGPGRWELDRSHYAGGTTPIAMELIENGMRAGLGRVFRELGTPAETLECRFVNGFMYTRLRPLVGGSRSATRVPPRVVLQIVSRVHPAFRSRRAALVRTMRERPWRAVVDDWHARIRPELEAANLGFQEVDLGRLSDGELGEHVGRLLDHCKRTYEMHFWLHGYDLGPIGLLLHNCARLGVSTADVVPTLEGASPSTSAPMAALATIRAAIDASGSTPTTLDEVRSLSSDVAAELDAYLRARGSMLFGRYDLDGATLGEVPHVVLATLLGCARASDAQAQGERDAHAAAARVRERLPAGERDAFDGWLAEARAAMDLRDDNGPNTAEWPTGLLRLGLLEVGRRLTARGDASRAEHAFELTASEARSAMTGPSPGAEALALRSSRRAFESQLDPPLGLGPIEPVPPLDALPEPMPTMIGAVNLVIAELGMARSSESATAFGASQGSDMRGSGVGDAVYRGRARRADDAETAIASMEPGDVLVVPFTTPAYNMVLGLAGAVVTAEGGPLSHAAVLARELRIPAVVGVRSALAAINDGDIVEVDPTAGVVRVVASPSAG